MLLIMNKLKNSFLKFMQGRYGIDAFYKFLMWTYFAVIILNIFIGSRILTYLSLFIFIYMFFRVFSKNIYKRQAENIKYWNIKEKVRKFINLQKNKIKYRKTHVYKKCPYCKANIKLPRKKGMGICNCPKCKKDFEVVVR